LMIAAGMGHASVAGELVKAGASVRLEDAAGKSAPDLARDAGHAEVLQILERAAAD
ncbi:MAG: ankyrin repeat domain-containing protein, partial [Proteobacteria bacterium]|nr:ankyrin repeat domain-containing protein [Pseudomonadota bacterium]